MKFFKLFIIAIAVTTLSSCSSDDDSSRSVDLTLENLAGTYKITLLEEFSELSRTASNGTEVIIETGNCEGDTFSNTRLVINTDGTYTTTGSYRTICERTIDGDMTTDDPEIESFESSGSLTVNEANNTITILDSGNTIAVFDFMNDVERFDSTRLYLTFTEVVTFQDETENFERELHFERVN